MSEDYYGMGPTPVGGTGGLDLSGVWHEFMHYLYLPVRIPTTDSDLGPLHGDGALAIRAIPRPLEFLRSAIEAATYDAAIVAPHLANPYVYVTARRGYASPGNPLNRPGWHTDDFGGTDLNYIWTDAFPTRFLLADEPLDISEDDEQSMLDMERYAAKSPLGHYAKAPGVRRAHVRDGEINTLLRLNPYVIHCTPEIPAPGGMRSFFKISVSTHRYDLLGNSHNYDLDYDWPMLDRQTVRNQPQADRQVI